MLVVCGLLVPRISIERSSLNDTANYATQSVIQQRFALLWVKLWGPGAYEVYKCKKVLMLDKMESLAD